MRERLRESERETERVREREFRLLRQFVLLSLQSQSKVVPVQIQRCRLDAKS